MNFLKSGFPAFGFSKGKNRKDNFCNNLYNNMSPEDLARVSVSESKYLALKNAKNRVRK
jgi:hypothetical protein